MASITYDLSAEEQKVVSALLKIRDAEKKVEDGFKGIASASAGVEHPIAQMNAGLDRAKNGSLSMREGVVAIGTGFGIAAAGGAAFGTLVNEVFDKMLAKGAEVKKMNVELMSALQGRFAELPEVRKELRAQESDIVSDSQKMELYKSISMKLGGEATPAIKMAAAKDAILGAGIAPPVAFGSTVGELMKGFGGELNEDDRRDVAMEFLDIKSSGLDEQDSKFLNRAKSQGLPLNLAMDALGAGLQSGEGPKVLMQLLEESRKKQDTSFLKEKTFKKSPAAQQEIQRLETIRAGNIVDTRELQDADTALANENLDALQKREGKAARNKREAEIKHKRQEIHGKLTDISRFDQDLSQEIADLQKVEVEVPQKHTREQERRLNVNAMAPNDRFLRMIQNPDEFAPEGLRAELKNLKGAYQGGRFAAARRDNIFTDELLSRDETVKNDRQLYALAEEQRLEVEASNINTDPAAVEARNAVTQMRNGRARMGGVYNLPGMDFAGDTVSKIRVMAGDEALDGQRRFESQKDKVEVVIAEDRSTPQRIKTTNPNAGNERVEARQ